MTVPWNHIRWSSQQDLRRRSPEDPNPTPLPVADSPWEGNRLKCSFFHGGSSVQGKASSPEKENPHEPPP